MCERPLAAPARYNMATTELTCEPLQPSNTMYAQTIVLYYCQYREPQLAQGFVLFLKANFVALGHFCIVVGRNSVRLSINPITTKTYGCVLTYHHELWPS
jgi:hypothetical protein